MNQFRWAFLAALFITVSVAGQELPDRNSTMKAMVKVNDYFMTKYADYSAPSNVGRLRPSNIWTRGVYY
ncbi:MAG: glycoside hydrolase family 88 protein, partial [Rikenellaceae bacterium]|nr:glycoside hydrolase family 88 protein [Rikenellaceae bacterium]